jgi:predicted secreted protein
MVALGNVNGNGKEDIAVLSVDSATGDNNVYVKDGFTGDLIRKITFSSSCEIRELLSVPDFNSNGVREVAVLCRNRTTDAVSVIIKDSLTGLQIKQLFYDKAFSPITAVVLPDMNSNGKPEIGVLGVNGLGNVQVQIKDASSAVLIKNVPYNKDFAPITAVVLPDVNGNNKPEIGVLGVNNLGSVQVQIKDASSGVLVKNVPYNKDFAPITAVVLPDINGNGKPEVGVMGVNSLGSIQVQIKDASSAAGVKILQYGDTITPVEAVVVPDIDGGGKPHRC